MQSQIAWGWIMNRKSQIWRGWHSWRHVLVEENLVQIWVTNCLTKSWLVGFFDATICLFRNVAQEFIAPRSLLLQLNTCHKIILWKSSFLCASFHHFIIILVVAFDNTDEWFSLHRFQNLLQRIVTRFGSSDFGYMSTHWRHGTSSAIRVTTTGVSLPLLKGCGWHGQELLCLVTFAIWELIILTCRAIAFITIRVIVFLASSCLRCFAITLAFARSLDWCYSKISISLSFFCVAIPLHLVISILPSLIPI